jgi:hypothetical protein
VTVILVSLVALTLVASARTIRADGSTVVILWTEGFTTTTILADTISSGILSQRGITATPLADSMVGNFTEVAATEAEATGKWDVNSRSESCQGTTFLSEKMC